MLLRESWQRRGQQQQQQLNRSVLFSTHVSSFLGSPLVSSVCEDTSNMRDVLDIDDSSSNGFRKRFGNAATTINNGMQHCYHDWHVAHTCHVVPWHESQTFLSQGGPSWRAFNTILTWNSSIHATH